MRETQRPRISFFDKNRHRLSCHPGRSGAESRDPQRQAGSRVSQEGSPGMTLSLSSSSSAKRGAVTGIAGRLDEGESGNAKQRSRVAGRGSSARLVADATSGLRHSSRWIPDAPRDAHRIEDDGSAAPLRHYRPARRRRVGNAKAKITGGAWRKFWGWVA
jgi:hypothetical protein